MRARSGIADGDRVRVVSAYGAAVLPARVSGAVRPGQLFATFHTADVFLESRHRAASRRSRGDAGVQGDGRPHRARPGLEWRRARPSSMLRTGTRFRELPESRAPM